MPGTPRSRAASRTSTPGTSSRRMDPISFHLVGDKPSERTSIDFTDLAIGGWQLASIVRWTSGLPFSLTEGGFTTDWEIASYGIKTGNFKAKKVYNPGNVPNAFGTTLANQITGSIAPEARSIVFPIPARLVERNNFRRDGNFGADASLTKPFKITESQVLRFTWEVFNVSNSVRFNAVYQAAS